MRETITADLPDKASTDGEVRRIDDRDVVWRALLVLPPGQRAVIVLRYYEDLSELEIAAVMGTSPGTVKSQAARGLRRLADILAAPDTVPRATNGATCD
jgi:RNA polymerase sigma factor (sigma-70 family)